MSDRLVVSTRKGLFWVERDEVTGASPRRFSRRQRHADAARPRSGHDYAVLNHGHFGVKLHRRANGVWSEVAAPAYPPKPEGLVDRDGWGKDIPYTLINIFALETGGPDEDGLLWCGTIPGGLFRSRDHGAKAGNSSGRCGTIRSASNGWAAAPTGRRSTRSASIRATAQSCGSAFPAAACGRRATAENAWACRADGMFAAYLPPEMGRDPNIQDPHRLVQSPSAPDRLWVAAPQRHLPQRRRLGELERDRRRSALLVRLRRRGPSRASPTRPGSCRRSRTSAAFRSTASSSSRAPATPARRFDVLRDGLPQNHAYDVVYRHALAVDESGDRLAFATTTGGLYVSEDQGDRWREVSHTLPPAHAVRFVP